MRTIHVAASYGSLPIYISVIVMVTCVLEFVHESVFTTSTHEILLQNFPIILKQTLQN